MKTRRLKGSNQYKAKRSTLRLKLALTMSAIALTVAGYNYVMTPHWETIFVRVKSPVKVYAAEEPMVEADPIEDEGRNFLRRVRILESSNGTNTNPQALHNICKARGKVNTIGYGGMHGIDGELFCFDSAEQEAGKAMSWYREHRETMSEGEAYCVWNIGVQTDTCPYWANAQSL